MSTLAEELDAHLQRLDPRTAQHVERLVRDVFALTEPAGNAATPRMDDREGLLRLAAVAEPMGAMTNAEIDQAVYGR